MTDLPVSQPTANPVKPVRIGARTFDIAGLSTDDDYFNHHVNDGYEPEFEQLCDDLIRYDYVCVDVGANIGMKTLLLAQYVPQGSVLAIEAGPRTAAVLEKNVAQGGFPNVTVVNSAVGDRDGTVRFADNSAWGHISPGGTEVPIRTLASLVSEYRLPRLDFAKIDVEGSELPILQSSVELFNRHQSLVHVEFNALTLMAVGNLNPLDFAKWIFDNFSTVVRVRRGAEDYLERMPADGAVKFLTTNLVHDGVVTDLLITNFAARLTTVPNRLRGALAAAKDIGETAKAERDAAMANCDSILAECRLARAERDAAIIQRDAALAHCDALLNSTSWRLTALVRTLASMVRGSPKN